MESSFIEITNNLEAQATSANTLINNGEILRSSSLPLLNTHRRVLRDQMQALIVEQDVFEIILDEQFRNPQTYPLLKRIDEWEKESINKIQQRAVQLRQQLTEDIIIHTRRLSNKLQELSNRLLNQRTMDTYIQADLDRWKKTLDGLKTSFTSPSTISINEYTIHPLVRDIYVALTVTNELFSQSDETIMHIEEHGQVVVHNSYVNMIDIRGRNEYTKGCHRIRLRMEQLADQWPFLGICSPYQSDSSISSYGWSSTLAEKHIEMKKDDIISLILDCEKSIITMINERSKIGHELSVDVVHCSLPWQLHVVLHETNSRIRILRG